MSMPASNGPSRTRALLTIAILAAAGLVAVTWYFTRNRTGSLADHPGAQRLNGQKLPNPLACCGYRMDLEGEVFVWQAPPTVPSPQGAASGPATMPAIP